MSGHVFLEYMSFRMIKCFLVGHESIRKGFTGGYVLLEVIYYMMACLIG